ncbi:MAG: hypothetical protein JW922_09180, partial [Paludibacteraceae bacterium]|nr:hypothetical protein [Paludibacteraceae bacterium]
AAYAIHPSIAFALLFPRSLMRGFLYRSNDLNAKFDNKMFKLIKKVAVSKNISNREARMETTITDTLLDIYTYRNNNPNGKGSGLVNGDPNVEKYIQVGKIPLNNVKAILLATDGLEIQGKPINNKDVRDTFFHTLETEGFNKLIELKHASEDADPDWINLRYKHSDDATGIYFSFLR